MIPFYIFYSMFGFQRTHDLAWAAGDSRAKGFLLGATSGRTTLNGEGLQHQDGHSHILASTIPNCRSYDPCYSYELSAIIQEGIKDMYECENDRYYYITLMNENYSHPARPKKLKNQTQTPKSPNPLTPISICWGYHNVGLSGPSKGKERPAFSLLCRLLRTTPQSS